MSCRHDCEAPSSFPARIHNRPGLDRITYRIGDYARFRENLLAALDRAGPLAAWTHRGTDDPGIALLEGAAEVAEVLAFYQELYANEAFLRTARWPESLQDLVALSGYRPAPGVAGQAVFAVAVNGDRPVTVPLGFGFSAELENGAAVFESSKSVTAHPGLNEFHLYRPRQSTAAIASGSSRLELAAVDVGQAVDAIDLEHRLAHAPAEGERILLMPSGGVTVPEIVTVREVEQVLDRIVLHLDGTVSARSGAATAYRIDRSFRHFGHAAPNQLSDVDEEGAWFPIPTNFDRSLTAEEATDDASRYSAIQSREMPLDTQVDDLPSGSQVICEGYRGSSRFTRLRTIEAVESETRTWGGLSGSTTVLRLNARLFTSGTGKADIRRMRFHEVSGGRMQLRAATRWNESADGTAFNFFGTREHARALAGRKLLLTHEDGRVVELGVASGPSAFDVAGRERDRWMWPLTLKSAPGFSLEDFSESLPRVTVYGNLVPADQGETQEETILGSGDRRRTFQTFRLPKAPLTHFLDPGRTPAQRPALEVHVDGVRWQPVESFLDQPPDARVYVLRRDPEGDSFIQFGNGKTGERLPTGRGNVRARYRVGVAARGGLAEGAEPSATGRLKPLDEVFLPGVAVNGGEAESLEQARLNAPRRLQALGRLVGVADYEAEANGLPGVLKAAARMAAPNGSAHLRVVVLTEDGDDASLGAVRDSLRAADRRRGVSRRPIVVVPGQRRFVYLSLVVGFEAGRHREEIEGKVRQALGVMDVAGDDGGTGLFALTRRSFGQDVHGSQVLAAVQQLDGVRWARVEAMQAIPPGDPPQRDPAELDRPDTPLRRRALACPGDRLLALYEQHLVLAFTTGHDREEDAA